MVKLRPLTDNTFLHSSLLKSILCPLNPEATSTHNRIENNQFLEKQGYFQECSDKGPKVILDMKLFK